MKILHIAPHLGGGVGKAHAALAEAAHSTRQTAQHVYALLEEPRDTGYVDRVKAAGFTIHVTPTEGELETLIAEADIVQVEWWNHPRLYALLARHRLPSMRLVLWVHISSLAPPLFPAPLADLADITVFTAPCSLNAPNLKHVIAARPDAFDVANSGFGFGSTSRRHHRGEGLRIGFMGTLDFIKLHPNFFDCIDAIEADISVSLWGQHNPQGQVATRAAAMRHPERIKFEGFTSDPLAVLSKLDVFFYLLAPGHYGTAENVLVEAMSVGAMPIVWNNPAETDIVRHGRTGIVTETIDISIASLAWACAHPERVKSMGRAAAADMRASRTPSRTLGTFARVYDAVMSRPRHCRDFEAALGGDAQSWFASSLPGPDVVCSEDMPIGSRLLSDMPSKGSLGHFRKCFPDDQSLR